MKLNVERSEREKEKEQKKLWRHIKRMILSLL
jgi:hypothetical protein